MCCETNASQKGNDAELQEEQGRQDESIAEASGCFLGF